MAVSRSAEVAATWTEIVLARRGLLVAVSRSAVVTATWTGNVTSSHVHLKYLCS